MFCPYLPLDRAYALGEWSLMPLSKFDGQWASADFEHLSKTFIGKFDDPREKPLAEPSLVVRAGVADGALPADAQIRALQEAIHLVTIDANPAWSPNSDAWTSVTSDNSELFIWPIDLARRSVALERGLLVRNRGGGYNIEKENWRVRPPLELHMPHGAVRLDGELLDAVYRTLVGQKGHRNEAAALELCISWLAKAWRNTPSVSWEDRLIDLKTAFDALVGESSAVQVAHLIRARFEALVQHGANQLSTSHLLWRPTENERVRTVPDARGNPQQRSVTRLEEWFAYFAAARNAVVHKAAHPTMRPPLRNRYRGPYFHTAERLLRESMHASLTAFGYTDLWRSRAQREINALIAGAMERLAAARPAGDS